MNQFIFVDFNKKWRRLRVIVPIVNVDSTIMSVDLRCGFSISEMSGRDFREML